MGRCTSFHIVALVVLGGGGKSPAVIEGLVLFPKLTVVL